MNLKELQKQLDNEMHERNMRGLEDFDGYSPLEMRYILYYTFELDSPIRFNRLPESDVLKIPIIRQVKYLIDIMLKNGEIKLTEKGKLPIAIVTDLYHQRFIEDYWNDHRNKKQYRESDIMAVSLARILLQISGLCKVRNGRLSLTKASQKLYSDSHHLLMLLFSTFATKFNWAYYDGYGQNNIGQLGCGFSLILLSKYGNVRHPGSFYAEKYFKAFPQLIDSFVPRSGATERSAYRCYSLRTFERFLDYFGLIKIESEGRRYIDEVKIITKTELFDKMLTITPPSAR